MGDSLRDTFWTRGFQGWGAVGSPQFAVRNLKLAVHSWKSAVHILQLAAFKGGIQNAEITFGQGSCRGEAQLTVGSRQSPVCSRQSALDFMSDSLRDIFWQGGFNVKSKYYGIPFGLGGFRGEAQPNPCENPLPGIRPTAGGPICRGTLPLHPLLKGAKIIDITGLTGIDSKCIVSVSMPGNDSSPRYQMIIDQQSAIVLSLWQPNSR